jgi:hypothetical protein
MPLLLGQARDAEVEDLGLARGQEHDVRGLDVAVHDALAMRVVQRLRHPPHDAQGLRPGQGRARGHEGGEGLAFQVLERDEQSPRLGSRPTSCTTTMFGWERRAAICASRRTAARTPHARGAHREGELDGLEGDGPPEDGVEGLVDDAHHPAPDLAADVVAPDGGGRAQLPDQHRLH